MLLPKLDNTNKLALNSNQSDSSEQAKSRRRVKAKFVYEKPPHDVPELVVEVSAEVMVDMVVELDEVSELVVKVTVEVNVDMLVDEVVVKYEVVDELAELDDVDIVASVVLPEDEDEVDVVPIKMLEVVELVVDTVDEPE